jgi:hypothetical protein
VALGDELLESRLSPLNSRDLSYGFHVVAVVCSHTIRPTSYNACDCIKGYGERCCNDSVERPTTKSVAQVAVESTGQTPRAVRALSSLYGDGHVSVVVLLCPRMIAVALIIDFTDEAA